MRPGWPARPRLSPSRLAKLVFQQACSHANGWQIWLVSGWLDFLKNENHLTFRGVHSIGVSCENGNENHSYFHEIFVFINSFPQFMWEIWGVCVLVLLFGDGRPEFSCKVSDRRVRADNGSVGHGSWAKWVNKSGWVTCIHWPMINMHPETVEAISIVVEGLKIS